MLLLVETSACGCNRASAAASTSNGFMDSSNGFDGDIGVMAGVTETCQNLYGVVQKKKLCNCMSCGFQQNVQKEIAYMIKASAWVWQTT